MIENPVINQAINYILDHIEEEISVEQVAEYCHFSKYYFNRVFKSETGESIYSYIRKVKMEQSAFRLKVERQRSITDIGLEYGYSASNYSTAFRQHHEISPVLFRKTIVKQSIEHPFFHQDENQLDTLEQCRQRITIEALDDIPVLYERRIGNYHNLELNWTEFLDQYKEYVKKDTLLIERTFDDPSITDPDGCLYDVCMSVDEDSRVLLKKEHNLTNTCILEGGRFAVYHFKGYPKQIYAAYQSIFNIWFPSTKYEIDDRYGFDIYSNVDCNTMYMEVDLCIPIR